MSGFYSNWFKVNHPNAPNDIPQLRSGGFQPTFYFGGAQAPTVLHLKNTSQDITGKGFNRKTEFKHHSQGKHKGQTTKHHKHKNIHMPRHMSSLHKAM
jgi:hypothetical protein